VRNDAAREARAGSAHACRAHGALTRAARLVARPQQLLQTAQQAAHEAARLLRCGARLAHHHRRRAALLRHQRQPRLAHQRAQRAKVRPEVQRRLLVRHLLKRLHHGVQHALHHAAPVQARRLHRRQPRRGGQRELRRRAGGLARLVVGVVTRVRCGGDGAAAAAAPLHGERRVARARVGLLGPLARRRRRRRCAAHALQQRLQRRARCI
jgi:hypothetical protein